MIYKLLNKFFGWDYIQWNNLVTQGVARVYTSKCGNVFYWRSAARVELIKTPSQVLWLTCDRSKYFKKEKLTRLAWDEDCQKDKQKVLVGYVVGCPMYLESDNEIALKLAEEYIQERLKFRVD